MKTILPVSIWFKGESVEATILSSNCSYDNLSTNATFDYQLMEVGINPENPYIEELTIVSNGSVLMDGQTYLDWDNNDYAYNWIAQQLNLTITGEYVPPVPPEPTPDPTPIVEETIA